MATPEEFNETLSQLVEGMRQLTEAVKTAAVTETDAEKTARETAERARKAADRDEDSKEYLRNRRKAADEAAIDEELKNLGIRKKSSGETEDLEEQRNELTKKVNEALKKHEPALAGKTDAELEAYKAILKLNSTIDEQVKQNDRLIKSTIMYDGNQNDLIRVSNTLLKQHQREIEISKTLGDIGFKQEEQFEDSIGKLKVQLASTVKLTDAQYKDIAAAENAAKAKQRDIELSTLLATKTERQAAAFEDSIGKLENQLASTVQLTDAQYKDIAAAENLVKAKQREVETITRAATAELRRSEFLAESINQIEKQIDSAVTYTATEADLIRTGNILLKQKEREAEASKSLGDINLRQQELFEESIGKLESQLNSTVKLTDSQYKDIAANENAVKTKQREIDTSILAATTAERQLAAFDESIHSIEKQTASLFAYDATQADAIRTANMALKEKQREVEASKNLGDATLRQKESFEDSIAKAQQERDAIVTLTQTQYNQIAAIEKETAARNKEIDDIKNAGKNLASMVGSIKDVSSALAVMKQKQLAALASDDASGAAKIIAKFTLLEIGVGLATNAFDLLVAGMKGYYEGILATQRALYAGERGEKLAQAANIAMYKAIAAQAKASGDSLINLGKEAAAAGIAISFMIPGSFLFKAGIAAVGLAVGGLTAAMGAAEKVAGELAERQAEVLEMYGEQMDTLFNGFGELGKSSMIGARGMEGLYENLHKVGFTVKEFDKLNKVLQTNARDMKMFGVTASDGVDKFVEVASGLVYGELGHTLRMMGISTEEMMDHQAKYMAQQARFGMLQNKTIEQLIKGTSDYIIELDKTAALTGASRKDQEEAMKYVMANEKLRAGMLVEEEKAKRTGDYTVLKQMQQAANLASKLYDAGQKRAATGAAEYYGSGKKVTGLESAEFAATFKGTIRDLNEGRKSDTTLYLQSTKEAYDAAGRVAGSRRYGANTEGLLGDSTQSIVDSRKRTESIEQVAKERGIKQDTPEFEKLVKELGQRAATDKTTTDQVKKREDARDAASKQDDAVRNKDLSAIIGDLGKPANMMVDAGNSMLSAGKSILDAGKYIWNSTFGGEKGEAENLSRKIMVKDEAITDASGRVDLAKKKLQEKNLTDKEKKEAEEDLKVWTDQVAMLKKQKAQMIEERKIHQDIDAIQGQRTTQQEDITKKAALRKETLLVKHNKERTDELAKYDAEVAAGKKPKDITGGTRRSIELNLNNKFQDELKKLENETNAAYRNIADSNEIKGKILNLNNELKELKLKGPSSGSAQTSGGGKTGSGGTIGLAGGSTISSSNEQLKDAGLRLKSGDVQKEGSKVDPKLLEIAKQAQANIPGFNYFSGFNDQYHQENSPSSQHTKGLAFDFTVNPGRGKSKPSKEDSDNIIKMLKGMGIDSVINEYDSPSAKATGGHFHAELAMPKAYDGGLFDGPKAGYPVELHGREAIVPLPDPSSKISVETPAAAAAKAPLNSILTPDNNSSSAMSNMSAQILEDLYNLMEDKFDSMISTIKDGNDISDKLLKYSRV